MEEIQNSNPNVINKKDTIIAKDNRGSLILISLSRDRTFKWRKKRIQLKDLIGQEYNQIYEVQQNGSLKVLENVKEILDDEEMPEEDPEVEEPTKMMKLEDDDEEGGADVVGKEEAQDEDSEENKEMDLENKDTDMNRDNRDIIDDNQAQTLSSKEIEALKAKGVKVKELVEKLAEGSKTYEKKMVYTQEKYLKKKKEKHLFRIKILKSTVENLTQCTFLREPAKIAYLRLDSLAYFLHLASLGKDSNVLLIENTKGLVLGAVAQRLNNQGYIHLCSSAGQAVKHLNQLFFYSMLNMDKRLEEKVNPLSLNEVLDPANQNKYTHLLIVGELDCKSLVERLNEKLELGALVVIFCQFLEPLSECFDYMMQDRRYLHIQIFDIFTREYQVLSNRTHPKVTMAGFSGYILSAYKL